LARALAELARRALEAIYGYRVTDELLRSRGIGLGRDSFLSRELIICSGSALAAALAVLALTLGAGEPDYVSIPAAAAMFAEVFVMVGALRGRRLARGRGRPVPLPRGRAPRSPMAGLLRRVFDEDRVRRLLELSGAGVPPWHFYDESARAALAGAVGGAASLGALAALERYPPAALAIWALAGLLAGLSVGMIAPYAYISYRASSRSSRIEQDLSTWAAAMMAYVSSGLTFPEALKRSASALRNGPLRRELETVIRDSEVLGSDPRSALLAMAQRSPSQLLREILVGAIDAMDSGKDLSSYFRDSLAYVLNYRRNYLRKLANDVALAAELFVMIFVVTPLVLAILLAVMGSMSVGAQPYYGELLAVIAFAFVPLVGLGYLLLVDSIYPRWW